MIAAKILFPGLAVGFDPRKSSTWYRRPCKSETSSRYFFPKSLRIHKVPSLSITYLNLLQNTIIRAHFTKGNRCTVYRTDQVAWIFLDGMHSWFHFAREEILKGPVAVQGCVSFIEVAS